MAWEEETIEGGLDLEEVGGKKSPLKLIIIIVVALAVLGGIGFGIMKFMQKPEPEPEEVVAEEVVEEKEAPEVGFRVNLDKFTLNLADKGSPRYLQTSIVLEVDNEEVKADLTDPDDKKLYMVKARSSILDLLRAQTADEINDPDTVRELRKAIVHKLNGFLTNGSVMDVYIVDLVVQ